MSTSKTSPQKKAKILLIAGSIVIMTALVAMHLVSKGIALISEGVFLILINFIAAHKKNMIQFGKFLYYAGLVLIISGLSELAFFSSAITLLVAGILLLVGGIYNAVISTRKNSS